VSDVHWTRAAVLRLAIASLVLIGALFLFVFPTSALLHQRSQLNGARERLDVLQEQTTRLSEQSKRVVSDEEIERLARSQFNMVRRNEQAWAIVPGPTTTTVPPPVLPPVP
jgi:cell division protein FtsB